MRENEEVNELKDEVAELTHLLDLALCVSLDKDRERSDSLERAEKAEATALANGYEVCRQRSRAEKLEARVNELKRKRFLECVKNNSDKARVEFLEAKVKELE
jgi:hypothetical protein